MLGEIMRITKVLCKTKMKTSLLLSVAAANTCEDRYDGQCLDWDNFKVS